MKVLHILFLSLLLIDKINTQSPQCTNIINKRQCNLNSPCKWVVSSTPTQKCTNAIAANQPCECILPSPFPITPCLNGNDKLDLVILVDASCPMTTTDCQQQQKDIKNLIKSIDNIPENITNSNQVFENMRLGYIEFGSTEVNTRINLDYIPNNRKGNANPFQTIRHSSICDADINQRNGNPLLDKAISEAIKLFQSNNSTRDRQILIFSNCGVTNDMQTQICIDYSEHKNDLNVVMVNNKQDNSMIDPQTYIMCLVEYDPTKIFSIEEFNEDVIHNIHNEICEHPTPAPTVDPTILPTASGIYSTETTIVSESTTRQITTEESIVTEGYTTAISSTSHVTIETSLPTQSPTITNKPLTIVPATITTNKPSETPISSTTISSTIPRITTTELNTIDTSLVTTITPTFHPTDVPTAISTTVPSITQTTTIPTLSVSTTSSVTIATTTNTIGPTTNIFTATIAANTADPSFLPTIAPTTISPTEFSTDIPAQTTIIPTNSPTIFQTSNIMTTSISTSNIETTENTNTVLPICCACLNANTTNQGCPQDQSCEDVVCATDSRCCVDGWDEACVNEAKEECDITTTLTPNIDTTENTQTTSLHNTLSTISPNKQWICNNTCEQDMDQDINEFNIAVMFSFDSGITYNLNNMKCFLYKIFELMLLEVDGFCIDLIAITDIIGGIENQDLCTFVPCISRMPIGNILRRLLQNNDGNITVIINTNDDNIFENINEMINDISEQIMVAFRDNFGIELNVILNINNEKVSTTIGKVSTTIEPTEDIKITNDENVVSTPKPSPDLIGLWILLGIMISCLLFVVIIMCIRKRKYNQDVRSIYHPPIYHDDEQSTDVELSDNEQQRLFND